MSSRTSVLIVEQSPEARDVLRTALEKRGHQIFEADGPETGLEMTRQHQPDLILLDLECETAGQLVSPEQFAAAAADSASLVMLGAARRGQRLPAGSLIAKPYHYRPLISKIEQLLAARYRAA